MAVGSFAWGALADTVGTPAALSAAALLLVLVGASVALLPLLPGTGTVDRSTRLAWATPMLQFDPDPTDGPVLITVSYTVRPASLDAFRTAMRGTGASRRRTGAFRWRLYRSGEEQDVQLEAFLVPSWSEYERQQTQRLTGRDREIQAEALAATEGPPVYHHYFPNPVGKHESAAPVPSAAAAQRHDRR
jgi:hypothetical protein